MNLYHHKYAKMILILRKDKFQMIRWLMETGRPSPKTLAEGNYRRLSRLGSDI